MKNGKIINIVNNEFRMRRESSAANLAAIRKTAMAVPEIAAAVSDVSDAQFAVAQKEITKTDATFERQALITARAKLKETYEKFGFKPSSFVAQRKCPLCADTGVNNGKYCKCFEKRYYEILCSTLGIEAVPNVSFSDADFSSIHEKGQREYLKKLYSAFERYAEKYPNVNTLNAIVTGGTGVGKSCLMYCVANRLTERGFNVMFVSAVQLNRLMLNYHTSLVAERGVYLDDIIDCDMLIVDDLGSEQKIRNVTDEYLLMILNEREMRNKPVFITSNLSEEQLKDAYPERIFSRLANKKTTTIREIIGVDLRLN